MRLVTVSAAPGGRNVNQGRSTVGLTWLRGQNGLAQSKLAAWPSFVWKTARGLADRGERLANRSEELANIKMGLTNGSEEGWPREARRLDKRSKSWGRAWPIEVGGCRQK